MKKLIIDPTVAIATAIAAIVIAGAIIIYIEYPITKQNQQVETSTKVQPPTVTTNKSEIPTLEQLEAQLKSYQEAYPNLIKQTNQMRVDMIVLQGAIYREKQLK